ncbi:hypothetical protein ES703_87278 [subsurface metagenome]
MTETQMIMSKRQNLTKMLRRLNRYFGKHIRIDWRPLAPLHATALGRDSFRATLSTWLHVDGIIELNGDERILDPQILAHAYAHFLATPSISAFRKTKTVFRNEGVAKYPATAEFYKWMHPERFFKHYREVCQVLGIPPVLSDLDACKRFAAELKQRSGAER